MLQTGRCVVTVLYFHSSEVFTLMKELHAFLGIMLLSASNASVLSVKFSWRKWFLYSKEQQIFWKQKDSESEAWAHSQVAVPKLVPVFTQISDLFKWELFIREQKMDFAVDAKACCLQGGRMEKKSDGEMHLYRVCPMFTWSSL